MRTRSSLAHAIPIALLVFTLGAAAQEPEEQPRTISVIGRGEVTVEPDLAVLSLEVETTGRTAQEATSANAAKSSAVVKAVKRLLGKEDSLKTTRYDLQPRYADRKPGSQVPPAIVGYVSRNQVRLELHELDSAGKIIDAALGAGANRVGNLVFSVEDRNPHVRAALARAGAEARAQAESIAEALGVKLGEVIAASTSGPPAPIRQDRGFVAMRAEAVAAPIEPGEVKISSTLHVTYAIE
jgi:uncharacterized protein YggE